METETAQETVADFAERVGVTMAIESVTTRGDLLMNDLAFHFKYTLSRGDQHLSGYYSMGIGNAKKPTGKHDADLRKGRDGVWQTYDYYNSRWKETIIPPDAPTLDHILDALASDASSVDNAPVFSEWAAEMGFTDLEEYEKARRTFYACCALRRDLQRLLGPTNLEHLMYECERL